MSAFYDQASLVVVPSGYKSGKIYAQKPLTTDGQLTFTRASTATRVNASGALETVASGVPRLDYTNSTCPKLLLEPQRSNLVLHSNDFTNAAWSKVGATITTGQSDPYGGTSASKVEIASGGNNYLYQSLTNPAGTKTITCWIKADTATTISFSNGGSTPNQINVTTTWTRYSFTSTDTAGGIFFGNYFPVLGQPALTFYVFQSQYEMGSYATSPIFTTSATVTRLEDAAYKTGISSLIGQTNGAFFVDITFGNSRNSWIFSLVSNNWQNDSFYLETFGANNYISINTVKTGAAAGSASSTFAAVNGIRAKIAVQYTSTTLNLFINGVKYTGTRTAIPACTGLYIDELGTFGASGNQKNTNRFNQVLTFTSALTDAQCIELTTL
jgi:hypothetical protein